jgi:hypothetical protein
MSIGELISMYREGELSIHPAYQRLFRWSDEQKSKLIDSILLGIPIPSIFVAQQDSGVWEIVDGLQRVATILQVVGVLKDPEGTPVEPLTLKGTEYLPSLKGKCWSENGDDESGLTSEQKLLIKRAKIDIQIVLKESDPTSKLELFQRLNTGGSLLRPMETRNCLLIMVSPGFADWIKSLAEDPVFRKCVDLSENQVEELYDRELVTRFLVFRKMEEGDLDDIGDMSEFVDKQSIALAQSPTYDRSTETQAFRQTFRSIAEALGKNAFKRHDRSKDRFLGQFLISAFEVIACGLGYHEPRWKGTPGAIERVAKKLRGDKAFLKNSGAGVRANTRVRTTIPMGRKLFSSMT